MSKLTEYAQLTEITCVCQGSMLLHLEAIIGLRLCAHICAEVCSQIHAINAVFTTAKDIKLWLIDIALNPPTKPTCPKSQKAASHLTPPFALFR
tara:strand:- start:326 stop:607 length:282 start_codon:yes stop_codon:yes gene_type:complete